MKSNWQYLLIAMVLAFISWFTVSFEEHVERTIQVPLEVTQLPEGLAIRKGFINKVEARIGGPKSQVRALNERELGYPLDLSGLRPGENIISLETGNIRVNRALSVKDISPQRITLYAEEVAERKVPVVLKWQGSLADDWKVVAAQTDPAEVVVSGPRSVVSGLDKVTTQDVNVLGETPVRVRERVTLQLPPEVAAKPDVVRADLLFGPETRKIWIKIPLQVEDVASRKITIDENVVRLHVDAPLRLLAQQDFREEFTAVVRFEDTPAPGKYRIPYRVVLPEYTKLLERRPETVEVVVRNQ